MEILESFIIECEECGSQRKINKDKFIHDLHYHVRNMSVETKHDFVKIYNCDKCKKKISITVKGVEFPPKVKYHQINEIKGGIFIKEPKIEIS